jgi:hypothetical protein
MSTVAASGHASKTSPLQAAKEAIKEATSQLGGRVPGAAVVFASPALPLAEVMTAVRRELPGTTVVGCSTAGEITERGMSRGGLAVLLIASETMQFSSALAPEVGRDPRAAAQLLARELAASSGTARAAGKLAATSVVLVDGLSAQGEALIDELRAQTGTGGEIVGGAAGDDGQFAVTQVASGITCARNGVAALFCHGERRWGIGVDHGLTPAGPRMRVTRATGNVVYELDSRPAFAVYQDHARERGIELRADSAGPFLINNELGIVVFDQLRKARAPLSVGADGSLTCAAEIPQGATVCILGGTPDGLVRAARSAAMEARERLDRRDAAAVLLFDCICRGTLLDDQFQREIDAVRSVFPDTPIAGFLTYGEIARYTGRLEGWHNTTAVVAAIPV